ncbi:MAG: hypothetical protein MUC83_00435 [Pirellula sp.]|jgi:hypothetical protein|nr:hypothetical protein [Pirellula sp.]
MMRLTWRTINYSIYIGAVALLMISPWGYWYATDLATTFVTPNDNETPKVNSTRKLPMNSARISLDSAQIQRAASVSLRRMNPPQVLPPTPPEPTKTDSPPPAAPALSFAGKLLGVIVDNNPKRSFAILELQPTEIVLVATGEQVSATLPGLIVSEVVPEMIVLQNGDQRLVVPLVRTNEGGY